MIARDIESEILRYCGRENIGVICYSPMGKGLLTGTFTAERVAAFSSKDLALPRSYFCHRWRSEPATDRTNHFGWRSSPRSS